MSTVGYGRLLDQLLTRIMRCAESSRIAIEGSAPGPNCHRR